MKLPPLPWESGVMLEAPWLMQCVMIGAAVSLSVITWTRERRRRSRKKSGRPESSGRP